MPRNHFRKKYCAQSGTLGKGDYGKSFCALKAGSVSDSLISGITGQSNGRRSGACYTTFNLIVLILLSKRN